MTKVYKPKVCKVCKETFSPERQFQGTCTFACAIEHGRIKAKDNVKKEKRKAVKAFKQSDKSHLMKIAQQTFNKYIRLRDRSLPCVSCQHTGNRQRHASHFRPVGRNSQHRFNEDNCHSACSICNSHLSGNLLPYREALILKIGADRVKTLEEDNTTRSYTVEELKEIIDTYKQKIKEM